MTCNIHCEDQNEKKLKQTSKCRGGGVVSNEPTDVSFDPLVCLLLLEGHWSTTVLLRGVQGDTH